MAPMKAPCKILTVRQTAFYAPLGTREERNAQDGLPPGRARPADPEDARARAQSRLGHPATHPAGLSRDIERESGLPLPRAAPARSGWRPCFRDDLIRQQSKGPGVPAHRGGSTTPRGGGRRLAPVLAGDSPAASG